MRSMGSTVMVPLDNSKLLVRHYLELAQFSKPLIYVLDNFQRATENCLKLSLCLESLGSFILGILTLALSHASKQQLINWMVLINGHVNQFNVRDDSYAEPWYIDTISFSS